MMLRTTMLALAIGLAAAPVTASVPPPLVASASVDPVRLAKARDLVEVMHIGTQMREMMRPLMMRMMEGISVGRIAAGAPTPTRIEQERANNAMSMMADEVGRLVSGSMPQIVESAALAYAHNLTAPEIDAATAFYRTPAGQSILARQPQIIADMNNSTQAALLKPMMAQMPAIIARVKAAQGETPSATPVTGK